MSEADKPQTISVESPCVRNCCLDSDDICLGCGRTLDEIVGWRSYDATTQRAVLERSLERQKQRNDH